MKRSEFARLHFLLTSEQERAVEWRASAPIAELAAALVTYKHLKAQKRAKEHLQMSSTIDEVRVMSLSQLKATAADLARNNPKKLDEVVNVLAAAVEKRADELQAMPQAVPSWQQQRHGELAAEIEQLTDAMRVLERTKAGQPV